jgi:hypothetical protein
MLLSLFLVVGLGIATPNPTSAQATRADSAAILLEAAKAFEAEGRLEVAEALYQYVAQRFGNTPAGAEAGDLLAGVPTSRAARSGRVELQVWTTTYGLWLGVALPGALGADEPEPYGLGLLAGGPLGFLAGRSLARDRPMTEGQVRAITLGGTWGTWQGFGWAEVFDLGEEGWVCEYDYCYEEGDNGRTLLTSAIVGGLAGIGTGLVLSKKPITSGVGTTVNFGALWGTWFGLAGSILADLEDDNLLAGTLVGGNAGLLATALMAPDWGWSRNRARLVSIAGVIGGLGGAGFDLLIQPEDEKVAIAIPLVGSIVGLIVGVQATKGEDMVLGLPSDLDLGPGAPFGGSLLGLDGGRLSVGIPAPFPTLLPVDGPRGFRWEPGLGVTLFRAGF